MSVAVGRLWGLVFIHLILFTEAAFGVSPPVAKAAAPSLWRAEKKELKRLAGDPVFVVKGGDREISIASIVLSPAPDIDTELAGPPRGTAIWVKTAGEEKTVDLRPALRRTSASHVYADAEARHIFILLESGVAGPSGSYIVIATDDGGQSWRRMADLKRPPFRFPPAEPEAFLMDPAGGAKLIKVIFKIDATMITKNVGGGGEHARKVAPSAEAGREAVFIVTSKDGGRHWSYSSQPWAWTAMKEVRAE